VVQQKTQEVLVGEPAVVVAQQSEPFHLLPVQLIKLGFLLPEMLVLHQQQLMELAILEGLFQLESQDQVADIRVYF
jgi:hypothetical protein